MNTTTLRPRQRWRRRLAALAAAGALVGCAPETNIVLQVPNASWSPESLDFGALVAGEETATLEVYLTNSGNAEMEASASLSDPAFTLLGEPDLVVPEDDTATLQVQFAPTELRDYAGELLLATDDPDQPAISVPMIGVGRVPYAPDIDLQPSNIVVWDGVTAGNPFTQVVEVHNVGDAPLTIQGVSQSGSGAFALLNDPTLQVIPPGQNFGMFVSYEPLAGQSGGDSGSIVITSDDPDEPSVTVNLEGNGGGGEGDYPVAVIDCPESVGIAGPQWIDLDGSASSDPLGGSLTYAWSILVRPDSADPNAAPTPVDQPLTSVLLDAAGSWEITLVVTSDAGLNSIPAKCRIDASPEDRIHVELSWGGPTSDMDLHVAQGLGEFYSVPADVSWCNANPDWGALGNPDDDGRLDVDDDHGYGPENVNVLEPADGDYQVRVHLFDDGTDGDTTATVTVWLDNTLAWSGSKVLSRNEVWEVGQIRWPQAAFVEDNLQPWDAEGVRECR
ncbi:MAG: choice-of-anchor D domain-containing protein [Myxococcota bacterium]